MSGHINNTEEKNKTILFGSLESEIKGSQKQFVWKEITPAVNGVGVNSRSAVDISIFNL